MQNLAANAATRRGMALPRPRYISAAIAPKTSTRGTDFENEIHHTDSKKTKYGACPRGNLESAVLLRKKPGVLRMRFYFFAICVCVFIFCVRGVSCGSMHSTCACLMAGNVLRNTFLLCTQHGVPKCPVERSLKAFFFSVWLHTELPD